MSRPLLNHFVYDRAERGAEPAWANGFIKRYDSVEIKESAGLMVLASVDQGWSKAFPSPWLMAPASAPQLLCGVPCHVCTFCRRHTIPRGGGSVTAALCIALPPSKPRLRALAPGALFPQWAQERWAGAVPIHSGAANVRQQSINYGWKESGIGAAPTAECAGKRSHVAARLSSL